MPAVGGGRRDREGGCPGRPEHSVSDGIRKIHRVVFAHLIVSWNMMYARERTNDR